MDLLKKYKKSSLDGFRECVQSFETTGASVLMERLLWALLEDPVYMNWVLRNLMKIGHFLELNSDDIQKVWQNLVNPAEVMARAFYKTNHMEKLRQELPLALFKQINTELENITELRKSIQETAQFQIIRTVRKLQEDGLITTNNPWRLPPVEVVKEFKQTGNSTEFHLNYEDGTPALEGQMVKNHREGVWKHYYPNGQLLAQGPYKQGSKEGPWELWYGNGQKWAEGSFQEDRKHGPWQEWNEKGQQTTYTYHRGKRQE